MADRLSIDKKVNDTIIPLIDKTKIIRLDKTSVDRIDLFLFAMAIGVKEGIRTPLSSSHGFILESSFSKMAGPMSVIYSLLVQEMRKNNEEEKISDKDEAFLVAQEYANTGFLKIELWLKDLKNYDDNFILWDLIDELDSKYEELFSEV